MYKVLAMLSMRRRTLSPAGLRAMGSIYDRMADVVKMLPAALVRRRKLASPTKILATTRMVKSTP